MTGAVRTLFPGRQTMPDLSWSAPTTELAADAALAGPRLFRFVHGLDERPSPMTDTEINNLGDAFTRSVLLTTQRPPLTLRELVASIESPEIGGFIERRMFVVDEGAVPRNTDPDFGRNVRLVFTWREAPGQQPPILLSTVPVPDDADALLQLIAWSEEDRAFHFFERKTGSWAWAGNSFHALSPPARGLGPFDSHINGSLVMKELKRPWSHWHTAANGIPRDSISDVFSTEPLFTHLHGAEELDGTVRTGISRWTKSRVEHDLTDGALTRLPSYFRQVLWCTSVNLVSSGDAFDDISKTRFDLPTTFFYDSDAVEFLISEIDAAADILPGDRLTVDAALYRAAVASAAITVRDDARPPRSVNGDTHFAFLVPERAEEDQAVLRELVTTGVLNPRLALCFILVDFANPVFSPGRAALLRHIPGSAEAGNNGQALTDTVTSAIQATNGQSGPPEAEFLRWWTAPDLLAAAADALARYHAALRDRLSTPDGISDVLRLATSRRKVLEDKRTLFEFHATLPAGPAQPRLAMQSDATLIAKDTSIGEDEL